MIKGKKAKRLLKKLDYLPRWAWYAVSFCIGPFGPIVVYVLFHALNKAAQDEDEEETSSQFDWDVDIDGRGVHVRKRRSKAGDTYVDADYTVSDDAEVDRQWARTEFSARQAAAREAQPEPAQEDADDSLNTVLREGRDALRRIRHANDIIADPALSAQIDSIENSCGQVLAILEQRPQLLPQLRTFLRYYLPTTLRLLDARAKLENGASTPKAREIRQRISEALGVVEKAFRKQVEALDEYRFIDLESEMDVLRDMLKADGLIDEEAQDDPFADVMSQYATRRGNQTPNSQAGDNDRNIPMATH